jgi:hypothetical protein
MFTDTLVPLVPLVRALISKAFLGYQCWYERGQHWYHWYLQCPLLHVDSLFESAGPSLLRYPTQPPKHGPSPDLRRSVMVTDLDLKRIPQNIRHRHLVRGPGSTNACTVVARPCTGPATTSLSALTLYQAGSTSIPWRLPVLGVEFAFASILSGA